MPSGDVLPWWLCGSCLLAFMRVQRYGCCLYVWNLEFFSFSFAFSVAVPYVLVVPAFWVPCYLLLVALLLLYLLVLGSRLPSYVVRISLRYLHFAVRSFGRLGWLVCVERWVGRIDYVAALLVYCVPRTGCSYLLPRPFTLLFSSVPVRLPPHTFCSAAVLRSVRILPFYGCAVPTFGCHCVGFTILWAFRSLLPACRLPTF